MKKALISLMMLVFLFPIGLKAQVNSSAYQSYQELLKSGDGAFTTNMYACFKDDPQSNSFVVIHASMVDKQGMTVIFQMFVDGISKWASFFVGDISPYSGPSGLFATLLPLRTVKLPFTNSHDTDAFEWGPDALSMKTGFGQPSPGEERLTWEFDIRRSTGRYTLHEVFGNGFKPDGFTVHETGKCVRTSNISLTPEEWYKYFQK